MREGTSWKWMQRSAVCSPGTAVLSQPVTAGSYKASLQTNRSLAMWERGTAKPPSSPTPAFPRALHRRPFQGALPMGTRNPVGENCIVAKNLPAEDSSDHRSPELIWTRGTTNSSDLLLGPGCISSAQDVLSSSHLRRLWEIVSGVGQCVPTGGTFCTQPHTKTAAQLWGTQERACCLWRRPCLVPSFQVLLLCLN